MLSTGPILVVEDDEDDRYFIQKIIQELKLPNPLHFFENGLEALHYLEAAQEQPFLILCDINMPLMNGLELRRRMNESLFLRRKSIPFVFLTTVSTPELIQQAYDETVQGFYQKAPDFASLQEQLKLIITYWQHCLHPNKPYGTHR